MMVNAVSSTFKPQYKPVLCNDCIAFEPGLPARCIMFERPCTEARGRGRDLCGPSARYFEPAPAERAG